MSIITVYQYRDILDSAKCTKQVYKINQNVVISGDSDIL